MSGHHYGTTHDNYPDDYYPVYFDDLDNGYPVGDDELDDSDRRVDALGDDVDGHAADASASYGRGHAERDDDGYHDALQAAGPRA